MRSSDCASTALTKTSNPSSSGVSGGPEEAEDAAGVEGRVDEGVEEAEEELGAVLKSTSGEEVEDAVGRTDAGFGASCRLLEGRCSGGQS